MKHWSVAADRLILGIIYFVRPKLLIEKKQTGISKLFTPEMLSFCQNEAVDRKQTNRNKQVIHTWNVELAWTWSRES